MIDFRRIEFLSSGNPKQRRAFEVLTQNSVLEKLAAFDPVLAGTIPIEIDIKDSDLDIICCWENKADFMETLHRSFGREEVFSLRELYINGMETVIANFILADFPCEVFGQPIPVNRQHAYRHMLVEYEILQKRGEVFRQEIIRLKQDGWKTEPAFAHLLGLRGDPYQELLEYKC